MNKNILKSIQAWNTHAETPCANDGYNLANGLGTLSGYHLLQHVNNSIYGMFRGKITKSQVINYLKINNISL